MSLINDMLRDLDKRKSTYPQHKNSTDGARITPVVSTRRGGTARILLWLIALAGLILLAVFVWQLYGGFEQRLNERLGAIEPEKAILVESNDSPERVLESTKLSAAAQAGVTEIIAVSVSSIPQGARIEIILSGPVRHRVLRNGQQLIIDLPETKLTAALPNLTRHPLIRAADVLSHAGGSQLEVDVARSVSVQSSMLSTQQNSPQTLLIVELIAEAEEVIASEVTLPGEDFSDDSMLSGAENDELTSEEIAAEISQDIKPSFEKNTRQLSVAERDQQTNRQAQQKMRAGQQALAQRLLSELLNDYPQAHQSRATLAALLLSQGATVEALRLLDNGLQLAPEQIAFVKLKARMLLSEQQTKAALTLLDSYQTQAGTDLVFLTLLATASQRDGQHQRSVALYQQLLARNNRQAQWWIGQAISLEALKQKPEALQSYLQARRLSDISPALKAYADERISQLN
ncbi:MAG: hypothetical protein V7745_06580 [Pseudomonadales bacterium]